MSLWVPPDAEARREHERQQAALRLEYERQQELKVERERQQALLRRELGLPPNGAPSAKDLGLAVGRPPVVDAEIRRRRKRAKQAKRARKRNRG